MVALRATLAIRGRNLEGRHRPAALGSSAVDPLRGAANNQHTTMEFDEGLVWKTVDGKDALIVFAEGPCLFATNVDQPRWQVCTLPEAMSAEIRNREGDLRIEEHREGDDIALLVSIGKDTLAYCSSPEAQRLLGRKPQMLFTGKG